MNRSSLGSWVDETISLWTSGFSDPDNGVDGIDYEVQFRFVDTPQKLAAHLGLSVRDLEIHSRIDTRQAVRLKKDGTYLGQFVGVPGGEFRPVQSAIDLARKHHLSNQ